MIQAGTLKSYSFSKKLNALVNALLILSSAWAISHLVNPMKILGKEFANLENLEVLVLFIGVLFVVNAYKQLGNIADYFLYWTKFINNPRISLVLTSMVLAIMPVKGRTIMSAPLIGQIAEKNKMDKMSAAIVDYVATHIVYFLLPIEGSVVVVLSTFAVMGYGLSQFISYMLPGILFLIAVVSYYSWKSADGQPILLENKASFKEAAKVSLPIAILMACLYLFEVHDVQYSIIAGTALFVGLSLLFLKPTSEQIREAAKSMDKNLILTLVLIFLFAATVTQLPFIPALAEKFIKSGLSLPIVIVAGYLIGFFTGDSRSMAAIAFPLLLPIAMVAPHPFQIISITYASLYAGYVASPAHPCCHYAASYFDTPYLKVWSRITLFGIGAAAAIIITALIRG